MATLSGVTLNINAEKAFVIFPNVATSKRQEGPSMVHTSGVSRKRMLTNCQQYANGLITRKDLVNSLVAYIEHDGN